jgi:hypothetical protein
MDTMGDSRALGCAHRRIIAAGQVSKWIAASFFVRTDPEQARGVSDADLPL